MSSLDPGCTSAVCSTSASTADTASASALNAAARRAPASTGSAVFGLPSPTRNGSRFNPTVATADRSNSARATGNPYRTTAPGDGTPGMTATGVSTRPTTTAASAVTTAAATRGSRSRAVVRYWVISFLLAADAQGDEQ